jgi:hypothetical protein
MLSHLQFSAIELSQATLAVASPSPTRRSPVNADSTWTHVGAWSSLDAVLQSVQKEGEQSVGLS